MLWLASSTRTARQLTNVRKTATVVSYENSQLIFQLITPRSSNMLDPRHVVPYYELPVYKTTGFETLPSRPNWGQSNNNGVFSDAQAKNIVFVKHTIIMHSRQDCSVRWWSNVR
ncbi:MAG: hypothetical protein ACKPKO_10435, partial [Candidatus Fonsibacter sp.]